MAPTADELTAFLHQEIPLTAFMRVQITHLTPGSIRLDAPLSPNGNPHGTAFAGSQSTLGILAGWTLVHASLVQIGLAASLVIKDSYIRYRRPIENDFWALAEIPPDELARFHSDLKQRQSAQIRVRSVLSDSGTPCSLQEGLFVATLPAPF